MGKARDGSECYTRQNKSGGNYVTCEGSQQKRAARQKLKAGGTPPVMTKKPKPVISQRPPGRIETGPLNPGTVVTDFDASAIVHEAPGVVGMTNNYPVGLIEGMFGTTPISQRKMNVEDLTMMMGIMGEVGKGTGKTTAAQMDTKMMLDKKARLGKLTKKELVEYLETIDTDWDDTLGGNIDDRLESYSYNPGYWLSRVSKRAEFWDDLTENQSYRLAGLMDRSARSDQRQHITEEFNKNIKGKKFKSVGDATATFKSSLGYYFR